MIHIFLLSFKHILYPADNTDVLLTRTQTSWPAKGVCTTPDPQDYSCLTPIRLGVFLFLIKFQCTQRMGQKANQNQSLQNLSLLSNPLRKCKGNYNGNSFLSFNIAQINKVSTLS